MKPIPRDFQREDIDAVLDAHLEYQCVLGRAATGLGKAVELAFLAEHYAQYGRVLILVDVKKLVRQLAATVEWVVGSPPGIEMGEERAEHSSGLFIAGGDRMTRIFGGGDRIVVSTVQTQYSGPEGGERFRRFDPKEFSLILLDECELFLAPKARSVVDYYTAGNPDVRVFGCTATPLRTDGVAMAELFQHVAFNRDIVWGIENGYLVRGRQAFVRVSLDASTLKSKSDSDDGDYSDADVAAWMLENEGPLIELAKGILHVAEARRSIVVCPDVATCKAVTHYLDSERLGCARVVYGEMDDSAKDDAMDSHQRGEFQFLVSVMMLTKGYDDPQVSCVINCRKTKSKRLYQQILGRGTRPLRGILDGLNTIGERLAAIASSIKPEMLMVNMVAVNESVRDITLLDILGTARDPEVLERAKELQLELELPADEAIAEAESQIEQERDDAVRAAEQEQARLDAEIEEEEERRRRRMLSVGAHVDVEYRDDLTAGGGEVEGAAVERTFEPATEPQIKYLVRLGALRATAAGYSKRQASAVIGNLKDKRETAGAA